MKFRCERDVLAEALATAGRAATSRTGTLPVLSGLRLELTGDELTVTGTDLELTIQLTITVGGERDGAVVRAGPARRRHRAVAAGRRRRGRAVEPEPTTVTISAGRSQFASARWPRRLPAAGRAGRRARSRWPPASVAEALRQVVRAASTDEARAVLTGVLLVGRGRRAAAWSPPTRTASPCATCPDTGCWPAGQKVLVPSRALQRAAAAARRRRRADGAPRRARRDVRVGRRPGSTTRLIEGEFPNYRNLLPPSHPNVLTVGREALLEALRRVKILAQDATPVRLALGGDTVAAHRDHPGRRQRRRGDRRHATRAPR